MLFNIFGGITRCDEVANGLVTAFGQLKPAVPFVVRLDGTNDEEGRKILAEAALPNVHVEKTMLGAAARSWSSPARRLDERHAARLRHRFPAVVSGTDAAPAEAGYEGTTPR